VGEALAHRGSRLQGLTTVQTPSMAGQPLVSVVVPFLNAGRFLDEAIESVFAQSYAGWELLLVDDGSSDDSREIAQRHAEQHPDRVRTLEHPGRVNRGQSASRNLGIRNARGELLAFLDADDIWLPHKLEHQVGILERHPEVGMVCGPSLYWHGWASEAVDVDRMVPVGALQDAVTHPPRLLFELYPLGRGAAPCPTSILLRRAACERVGNFEEHFRGAFSLYEDQLFLSKIYLDTPVFVSSLCCDYYRQHTSSISSVVRCGGQYDAVRLKYLNWLEGLLAERGCEKGEVWDALQRALYGYRHPVRSFLSQMRANPRRGVRGIGSYLAHKALPRPALQWVRRRLVRPPAPQGSTDQPRARGR
jgi:glycosyltransferase involved in cell wall biosynthesis